jgi:hypothetical protein
LGKTGRTKGTGTALLIVVAGVKQAGHGLKRGMIDEGRYIHQEVKGGANYVRKYSTDEKPQN